MKKLTPFFFLMLSLLAACSGIPQRDDEPKKSELYAAYTGEPVNNFNALAPISSWHALSRDQLVVWTGVSEAYVLRVDSFCTNLESAETISVTTTGSSVQSGLDSVRFHDGFRSERCRILEIRPLDYQRMRQETKKPSK